MPVLHEILLISSALLKIARQSHYKYFLLDHSLGHVKFVPFGGTGPGTCTTKKTTTKPAPVAGRGPGLRILARITQTGVLTH